MVWDYVKKPVYKKPRTRYKYERMTMTAKEIDEEIKTLKANRREILTQKKHHWKQKAAFIESAIIDLAKKRVEMDCAY